MAGPLPENPQFFRCCSKRNETLTPTMILVQNEEHENLEKGLISLHRYVNDAEKNMSLFNRQYNFTLFRWEIYEQHFTNIANELEKDLNTRFWHLCGPNIKILKLIQSRIPYSFTVLPYVFWKAVPKLEKLSLQHCWFGISKIQKKHSEIVNVEDSENYEQLLQDCKDLANTQIQVNFLEIQNLKASNEQSSIKIQWSKDTNIFPELKEILVYQQDDCILEIPHAASLENTLNNIDVMNFSTSVDKIKCESFLKLPTRQLSFDCGLATSPETVTSIVESQGYTLEKLCLFRAPFAVSYNSFPCRIVLEKLTKCHLWGHVALNLSFLKLMPFVQKFTWTTNCYEEKTHGVRLHDSFDNKLKLQTADVIIRDTKDALTVNSMETFHLPIGPISMSSLKKLGKMFPRLKAFKATLDADSMMIQAATQWKQLERLELAHGSMISSAIIIDVITKYQSFKSLKHFTWEGCACFNLILGEEELRAINQLKIKCGDNVVYPWKKTPVSNSLLEGKCLRNLFEEAFCDLEAVGTFHRALAGSKQSYK